MPFDRMDTECMTQARMDHLAGLGLSFWHRRVLEVGAGIGNLTGFFKQSGCQIISTDGRFQNVNTMRKRHPDWEVYVADLNSPGSHNHLGHFDVIFCYGVLYHIADPERVLTDLAAVCNGLFLLETMVWPMDDGQIHPASENPVLIDQSLDGRGCRPARDWLWNTLQSLFPFVYASRTQPDHAQYPLHWPSQLSEARAVFVGAREELTLPTLIDRLPSDYARFSL